MPSSLTMTLPMASASAASVPTRMGTHSLGLGGGEIAHRIDHHHLHAPRPRIRRQPMLEHEAWPAEWPLEAPK